MSIGITTDELKAKIASGKSLSIFDVRRLQAFQENPNVIPGATHKDHEQVASWSNELSNKNEIVVYCVHGHQVSQNVAAQLEQNGFNATYLIGGIAQWLTDGGQTIAS